jgi:hypothetical protein
LSPAELALIIVDYLGFPGSHVELNSCGTGLFSPMFRGIFGDQLANELAALLRHDVTVRSPRGEWFVPFDGSTPLVIPGSADTDPYQISVGTPPCPALR